MIVLCSGVKEFGGGGYCLMSLVSIVISFVDLSVESLASSLSSLSAEAKLEKARVFLS